MAEAIASTGAGSFTAKAFVEAFSSNTSFEYDSGQGTVQQFEDALENERDKGRQTLYMAFGRQTAPWTPDDNIPNTPVNQLSDYDNFYDNIVGLKAVSNTDIQVVLERTNFIIGESYTIGDVVLVNDTSNSKYKIYKLLNVTAGGTSLIVSEDPKLVTPTVDKIVTTTEATWLFLYDISTTEKFKFSTGSDTLKDGSGWMLAKDEFYSSGARAVMIYVRLGDEANTALLDGFRQIGIIRNAMKDKTGGNLEKLTKDPKDFYLKADIKARDSGSQRFIENSIIYLENRTLIKKTTESFEDIRVVIRF